MIVFKVTDGTANNTINFLDPELGFVEFVSFLAGTVPDNSGFVRDTFNFILAQKSDAPAFYQKLSYINQLAQYHWSTQFKEGSVWVEYQVEYEGGRRHSKIASINPPPQMAPYLAQKGLTLGSVPIVIARENGFRKVAPNDTWLQAILHHPHTFAVSDPGIEPGGPGQNKMPLVSPHVSSLYPYDYLSGSYKGPVTVTVAPEDIQGDMSSILRMRMYRGAQAQRAGGFIAKKLVRHIDNYETWDTTTGTHHWRSLLRTSWYDETGSVSNPTAQKYQAWSDRDIWAYQGNWNIYGINRTDESDTEASFTHHGRVFHGSYSTPSVMDVRSPWKTLTYTAADTFSVSPGIEWMSSVSIPRGAQTYPGLNKTNAPDDYYVAFQTHKIGTAPTCYNHGFFMLPTDVSVLKYGNIGSTGSWYTIELDGDRQSMYAYSERTNNLITARGGEPYVTGGFFTLSPEFYNIFFFLPFKEVRPYAAYPSFGVPTSYYGPPTLDLTYGIAPGTVELEMIPRWRYLQSPTPINIVIDPTVHYDVVIMVDSLQLSGILRLSTLGMEHPAVPLNTLRVVVQATPLAYWELGGERMTVLMETLTAESEVTQFDSLWSDRG